MSEHAEIPMSPARAVFDRVVRQVRDWDAPTPCADWTARDLLNHMVSEQLWVPHLLRGETLADVGERYDGDVVGDSDPVEAWDSASAAAAAAWASTPDDRAVHLSMGERPAADYRWQMTLDLAVHGWDLARSAGVDPQVPVEVSEALLAEFADQVDDWRPAIFDEAVAVDPGAPVQDRLVAFLGRDPRWRA